VSRDAKGNAVALVVGADGKVEERKLALDRAIGDRWLVTQGLADGDQVIVEGLQKVRPGVPVKPVPFVPRPAGAAPAAGGPPATAK
jgi:membrane fusion protein (multidrug efflux system)